MSCSIKLSTLVNFFLVLLDLSVVLLDLLHKFVHALRFQLKIFQPILQVKLKEELLPGKPVLNYLALAPPQGLEASPLPIILIVDVNSCNRGVQVDREEVCY